MHCRGARRKITARIQADRADAGRDVQALVAFDAERLQRDRLVETADQHVGAEADADRGARRRAGIVAFKRAGANVGRGREHAPHQHAAFGVTDVDAELGDRAGVVLSATVIAAESAVQILGRTEHKAPAAGDVAGQRADLHAMRRRLGGTGERQARRAHGRAHHQAKSSWHIENSPVVWSAKGPPAPAAGNQQRRCSSGGFPDIVNRRI